MNITHRRSSRISTRENEIPITNSPTRTPVSQRRRIDSSNVRYKPYHLSRRRIASASLDSEGESPTSAVKLPPNSSPRNSPSWQRRFRKSLAEVSWEECQSRPHFSPPCFYSKKPTQWKSVLDRKKEASQFFKSSPSPPKIVETISNIPKKSSVKKSLSFKTVKQKSLSKPGKWFMVTNTSKTTTKNEERQSVEKAELDQSISTEEGTPADGGKKGKFFTRGTKSSPSKQPRATFKVGYKNLILKPARITPGETNRTQSKPTPSTPDRNTKIVNSPLRTSPRGKSNDSYPSLRTSPRRQTNVNTVNTTSPRRQTSVNIAATTVNTAASTVNTAASTVNTAATTVNTAAATVNVTAVGAFMCTPKRTVNPLTPVRQSLRTSPRRKTILFDAENINVNESINNESLGCKPLDYSLDANTKDSFDMLISDTDEHSRPTTEIEQSEPSNSPFKLALFEDPDDESFERFFDEKTPRKLTKPKKSYYPVFHSKMSSTPKPKLKEIPKKEDGKKERRNKVKQRNCDHDDGKEQLIIDVGQKGVEATQCSKCDMIYTPCDNKDDKSHTLFHNLHWASLKFEGWKKERILQEFPDGRILQVLPTDPKYALQKVDRVRAVVDNELGFSDTTHKVKDTFQYYLFVSTTKKIVGFVIAEPLSKAHRVIADNDSTTVCCQEEAEKSICGISRVWTLSTYRRLGIARRLLDSVRSNFIYGYILSKQNDIAFTFPTQDGLQFAESFTGTKTFLVYK